MDPVFEAYDAETVPLTVWLLLFLELGSKGIIAVSIPVCVSVFFFFFPYLISKSLLATCSILPALCG